MPAAMPAADPAREDVRPAFAPTRAESGALAVLVAGLTLAVALLIRPGVDPTPSRPAACRLDVNAATAEEWALLRGVGPALAGRIVTDRAARGPFAAPPDLLAVKGVGPKTLARLEPHLRFPLDPAAPEGPGGPPVGPALAAR